MKSLLIIIFLFLPLVVMMPVAAGARSELSETSYFCGTGPTPKGMVKIECDVKGSIGKVPAYSLGEPRIEIDGDCLATMEAAMRAVEPYIVELDEKDQARLVLRNFPMIKPALKLWAEARRCWSK